ncbi:MAG: hypothetical protein Q9185_000184 [Variospora sp. 1 TL-2023]
MSDGDTPKPGHWPVDPQEDVIVSPDRIWIDGCFDFSHHELLVGVHSDEEILENKGPTVMKLAERLVRPAATFEI